jgi:hypothetical protein
MAVILCGGGGGGLAAVICSLIAAAASVAVAIITHKNGKAQKRTEAQLQADRERTEHRAAVRAEESLLSMQMQSACIDLALATALAVERQETNGEMKAARDAAKTAQEAYKEFLMRQTAEQVVNM